MSKALNHTPGPWETNISLNPFMSIDVFAMKKRGALGDAALIASIPAELPKDFNVSREEIEANAKLIAKAPELLAAATDCLGDLLHYTQTHGPGPGTRFDALMMLILEINGFDMEEMSKQQKPLSHGLAVMVQNQIEKEGM